MSTVVEPIVEEVATNLEEVAAATRTLNVSFLSGFSLGLGVGVAVGFYFGYRYDRKKLYAEAQAEAQKDIDEARETYRRKMIALESEKGKKDVDEILKERHYVTKSDLNDDPQNTPIQSSPVMERPRVPPVPILSEPNVKNWDYRTENANRNPRLPFVIHEDEFSQDVPGYEKVSYTYYELDEVLVDEDNSPIENVDEHVGAESLQRFGHGATDPNVVYVQNNNLLLYIEITREPNKSYEEEVLGLDIEVVNPDVVDDEPDE